jgi:hypothetical protein
MPPRNRRLTTHSRPARGRDIEDEAAGAGEEQGGRRAPEVMMAADGFALLAQLIGALTRLAKGICASTAAPPPSGPLQPPRGEGCH